MPPDGSVANGGRGLTGYTVITAADIDAAVHVARSCPVLAGGGSLAVNEAIDM